MTNKNNLQNFDLLFENFPNTKLVDGKIHSDDDIFEVLKYLKTKTEYQFNMLIEITAFDMNEHILLRYTLYSLEYNTFIEIFVKAKESIKSIVSLYKSANFEEREIFDMFGVKFEGHPNLTRLYMPETWKGHPLLKSYTQSDERLAWNDWD